MRIVVGVLGYVEASGDAGRCWTPRVPLVTSGLVVAVFATVAVWLVTEAVVATDEVTQVLAMAVGVWTGGLAVAPLASLWSGGGGLQGR
ncbi:MAG TPA: hypothetical protein VE152_13625 [Acidimicrobiales bacterium]|nr:hypothetical protein [Acidimicrobiales bacterium]